MGLDVPSGALVAAPSEIFDYDAVLAQVAKDMDRDLSEDEKKTRIAEILKPAIHDARLVLKEATLRDPYASRPIIRSYTYLAECVLKATLSAVIAHVHTVHSPTEAERLSLLFVGGSGRAEMAPFSDIDVLFLTPYKQTAWGESVVESLLYVLWDLKLKVGYAVRTVSDCIRLAREDITIRTNLLESRFLMGDGSLADELETRLWAELFEKTGPEFVEAKLEERADRHQRNGRSRYLLEPNVKEGKGGLRDLQTLYWIAKYLYHTETPRELVGRGVFTDEEFQAFEEAEMFLWSVSLGHAHCSRAGNRATFL